MTITITKPQINVREKLKELDFVCPSAQEIFWFEGDGSETEFALINGWKPRFVYNNGEIQKEGSGDDYEVIYDGFIYTVSFAVAPTNGNDVGVIAEQGDY